MINLKSIMNLANRKEKIILGLDPGTQIMGYAVLQSISSNLEVLQFGVIRLEKYNSHELKLKKIFERVSGLVKEFSPDEIALEAPFYGKNVQSMLKLGRAQGVAMAAGLSFGIPIAEYAPKKVKQSVTGNGNASKEQVAKMMHTLLKIKDTPKLFDATDALAVAVTHIWQGGKKTKSSKSWKAFISENPGRVND